MGHQNSASIYTIPISGAALTTANAWDLATVTADSSSRFELISIDLQISTTGTAINQGISLSVMRGSTAASTGAAITPVNIRGWVGALAASLTATNLSSTVISTTSASVICAGAFDLNGSFCYRPDECERPVFATGQRMNIRTSTPQLSASVHGNIVVREIGKGLPS